jgi:hypothetical protein
MNVLERELIPYLITYGCVSCHVTAQAVSCIRIELGYWLCYDKTRHYDDAEYMYE